MSYRTRADQPWRPGLAGEALPTPTLAWKQRGRTQFRHAFVVTWLIGDPCAQLFFFPKQTQHSIQGDYGDALVI